MFRLAASESAKAGAESSNWQIRPTNHMVVDVRAYLTAIVLQVLMIAWSLLPVGCLRDAASS